MPERIELCISQVPPLSAAAVEAVAILNRPNVDLAAALAALNRDPALVARVLRLANSPFFGCSGRIATLREAVLVLGMRTLHQAVVAAAVMKSLDGDLAESGRRWRHAMVAARGARLLAEGRTDPDLACTAALLHDFGAIVLNRCLEGDYHGLRARAAEEGRPLHELERMRFGLDHAEVGARVAARWHLPQQLVDAIGRHHRPDEGRPDTLVDLVHVADVLAHALASDEESAVPPISEQAWRRLGLRMEWVQSLFTAMDLE